MIYLKHFPVQKIGIALFIACVAGLIGYIISSQAIYRYYERYGVSFIEKKQTLNLNIQVCNKTDQNIEHASIMLGPDFGNIDSDTCSLFQPAEGLYEIIPLFITILTPEGIVDRYENIPIDYVGETLLEAGSYTLNILSLDTSPENATLIYSNGVKYEIVEE